MLGQQMRFQTPSHTSKGDSWVILFTLSSFPIVGIVVMLLTLK